MDVGIVSVNKFVKDGGTSHVDEKHALAEHLRSIAPFNKRWQVTETINEGTYGVVFAVRDVETGVRGVIKVAKSVGDDAGNQTAEWEAFILEKIYKQNPHASVVRLLDKGVLADQNGDAMQFMVLEKAEIGLLDYLNEFTGTERKLKVTQVSLQLLKGLYDMHREGLLHRDVKPDNMGILSREQPYVVLFDLGMTRMYTDEVGQGRIPRTSCPFRGTPEWASGWAQKGREQNRFDDLIGWLYVSCELFDTSRVPVQPLPWTYRRSNKVTLPKLFLKPK
ncbi:unnamed protein product [Toxocara canis]|uniref:Protein kinase domain-containing protein n=1 Tax=Toxocara canis TaxID=6265 RepID=A0A183VD41_TOXCA|nr:unnamed protein product [Toxocara canis]